MTQIPESSLLHSERTMALVTEITVAFVSGNNQTKFGQGHTLSDSLVPSKHLTLYSVICLQQH